MSTGSELTLDDGRELVIEEPELSAQEKAALEDECVIEPGVVVAVNFYDRRGRTDKKTALGVVEEGPLAAEKGDSGRSFTVRLVYPFPLVNITIGVKERDLLALYKRPEGNDGDIELRELMGALLLLARRLDKRNYTISVQKEQLRPYQR